VFTATCTAELAHFSEYALIAPLDSDGDGVFDRFPPVADNWYPFNQPRSDLRGRAEYNVGHAIEGHARGVA
jgi:hypothetical protein